MTDEQYFTIWFIKHQKWFIKKSTRYFTFSWVKSKRSIKRSNVGVPSLNACTLVRRGGDTLFIRGNTLTWLLSSLDVFFEHTVCFASSYPWCTMFCSTSYFWFMTRTVLYHTTNESQRTETLSFKRTRVQKSFHTTQNVQDYLRTLHCFCHSCNSYIFTNK